MKRAKVAFELPNMIHEIVLIEYKLDTNSKHSSFGQSSKIMGIIIYMQLSNCLNEKTCCSENGYYV